jgi:hypothetical protein
MVIHNLCTQAYKGYPAKSKFFGGIALFTRRFIGTDLTSPIDGVTPVDGDSFKIGKLSKHHFVREVATIVTDADDTSDIVTIGYTDGTNTSATAFGNAGQLNSTGVVIESDDSLLMDEDDYYITITVPDISNLDDDCEFTIAAVLWDISPAGITTAITSPV